MADRHDEIRMSTATLLALCEKLRARLKSEADSELDAARYRAEQGGASAVDSGMQKCAHWISKHIAAVDLADWLSKEIELTKGQILVQAHGAPIPLILNCPVCGYRHVDKGEFATKVHHTHACQACGLPWRPAIEPTVGVQYLPGFKDEES